MPELYLKSTDKHLGHISEDELKFLAKHLEEESLEDEDYTITSLTLAFLKEQKIGDNLLKLLEEALGEGDEVEVKFTRS
ncbi:MAG TPA: hypothetical protein VI547_16375 [Anaerolineales bacterium]|nr:hypothetical protein [Anaerolineales bacterium]HLF03563.1 hypothetical protein [Anaerolineales bacterium]